MEDDPLVVSIPVFLNKRLNDGIFIVQQPLRPADRPYETDTNGPAYVRVRPKNKKLEVAFDLKQDANYNRDSHTPTDRLVIRSRSVSMHTNTLVGVFHKDHLNLTPVSTLMRMRPSFDHMNKVETRIDARPEDDSKAKKPDLKAFSRTQKTIAEQHAPSRPKTWAQLQAEQAREVFTIGSLLDARVSSRVGVQ